MESTIYRFILRYSKREQIILLVMTLISFPFLYYSLDLPKRIVNEALGAKGTTDFPITFLGIEFHQLEYLWTLSGLFLVLVFINGGFKYWINVYRGRLGERMLRRLRYELYTRILRFPIPHFRRVSQGEIIPMVTQEVEPLGGFIGDSISLPAFQGGTLITILFFMFMQDPILGAAAIALSPVQAYVIPKLQRRVNALGKQRVRTVRVLSDRIGETISGVQEIHANNMARLMLARFSAQLGVIYDIRFEIYQRKFVIKFLNNFIAQLTPFFFYAIGGYLVIMGELSLGALVAVLAAYKDLSAPWKELLNFYQQKEDARIKYEQVIDQFDLPEMMAQETLIAEPEAPQPLDGELRANNLGLIDDDGEVQFEGVAMTVPPGTHMALFGPGGAGNEALAMTIARLMHPTSGRITVGQADLHALPEAITGRRMGYVGPSTYVFSSTIRENLLLGVMHRPTGEARDDPAVRAALETAAQAANSTDDPGGPWVDPEAVGDGEGLVSRLVEDLMLVELDDDCYGLGLRGTIDPQARPQIAERILAARRSFAERLAEDPEMVDLVEPFAADRYNTNASLAENLLFGTPVGPAFQPDTIAAHPYVRRTLASVGLTDDLLKMGRDVAATMVELFADLPSDHEFFGQFSFISPDDLPEFQALLNRVERIGLEKVSEEDRARLLSLPFKLIPARHRLGMLDDGIQARVLEARVAFARDLPEELQGSVAFFSADAYNAAASLQDNILFGKIAYGQADSVARVGTVIGSVLDDLDLRPTVMEVGLDFEVGIAGARLSSVQRQKIGIARAMLRRPDILVLNDAVATFDAAAQRRLVANILQAMSGRTVIWSTQRPDIARLFPVISVMRGGRLAETGAPEDLDREGRVFHEIAARN
ncbi:MULTISPECIES: ABC transporter transmembrane domain-containing protein [Thalassobaculum]|uniref:ABC-type multidrug transport system, ATPase and permease component n=1 Tax=Thalassobaculum litoreum DSM 18839 TaxID=1123362 RepID=A0A8G2EX98_9PROT|nr:MULTISPECIES: ABC transporter transmembrane domain-containing protein [Thalassobaculum]SDG10934.1 ABC-type multidrug transport system, ATPase and permease component [Thalassobaculum litoreum DSM 18839]